MKPGRLSTVRLAVALILAEKFHESKPRASEPSAPPIEPPHVMPIAKWERMQQE